MTPLTNIANQELKKLKGPIEVFLFSKADLEVKSSQIHTKVQILFSLKYW